MEESEFISFDLETRRIRLSPVFRSATFFDVCDPNGRILHKLNADDGLEYDLSFLPSGRYMFCTVCEGEPRKFYFTI